MVDGKPKIQPSQFRIENLVNEVDAEEVQNETSEDIISEGPLVRDPGFFLLGESRILSLRAGLA